MFEAKPPIAVHALPCAAGDFADEDLFAFSWNDLIARLCATQELRNALAHIPSAARASFDALTAEHLANRSAFAPREGKQGVNLAPSGNVKAAGANDGSSAATAQSALRGIA